MSPAALRPLVICYHSISDEWPHQLAVSRRAFEQQVTRLRRRLRPLSAGDVVAGQRDGFHITFDDAYRDIGQVVPVLERLQAPATVFVSTAFADEGRPLDIPELAGEAAARPERLATMRWDELRELAARGFEIGSHTVSHAHLPELSSDELARELVESRGRIEAEIGRPCRLLAYPFGEHDGRVQDAARRAGYAAAFGLWPGTRASNRYALPRVDLYRGDSPWRVRLKTSFAKPYVSGLLLRVR
jgi:peptidoglycan/xylan/chitin deacetylase (PgdA/CDA1 family)